ncbi:DUF5996 family protein [Deinococcus aluminii]
MTTEQAHSWPELNYQEDQETIEVIHLLSQMLGKVRLTLCPRMNQYWQVALNVGLYGLTTGPVQAQHTQFQITLDLVHSRLVIQTQDGRQRDIALQRQSMADYFAQFTQSLRELELHVHLWPQPQEIENAVRFDQDHVQRNYDPDVARRYFQVLGLVSKVLQRYRDEFQGKSSPVLYWWGGADLTVTRFSGRTAPAHPPSPLLAYKVIEDAYSHEECSAGFWAGGPDHKEAAFYAYHYPEPKGYPQWPVQPAEAKYDSTMGEFLLPYQAVRDSDQPEVLLMSFLHSTYEAAATLAQWNQAEFKYVPT